MSRLIAALTILLTIACTKGAGAEDFSALTRVDAARSGISAAGSDGVALDLYLDFGVPWRLFTLDSPPRLVVDFREVDWSGVQAADLLKTDRIKGVQFGTYVPGWSRLVADLGGPMGIETAALKVEEATRNAHLAIRLKPVSKKVFAERSGAPHDPRWDLPAPAVVEAAPRRGPDDPLVVVLDPGHGGVDPGAETDVVDEKDLMLTFARELREVLLRTGGYKVVLTREDDSFVSLERRVSIAHQAGADVFISLHADSLAEGAAHGATVHMLSRDASDEASAKMAERHDRADLLAGMDLSETDDEVTGVLMDLARQETAPRTRALAEALVDGMAQTGGPMNRRPLRSAAFSVLKAADIPSVLIEIGFLSSPRDLSNLQNPEWRATMARGIRNGLAAWTQGDAAQRPLVRQ